MNDIIQLSKKQKIKIGQKIHDQRIKNAYSIAELAQKLGMSEEALERMENGDFELFDDLAEYFFHSSTK